jgi:hypothetical protein
MHLMAEIAQSATIVVLGAFAFERDFLPGGQLVDQFERTIDSHVLDKRPGSELYNRRRTARAETFRSIERKTRV